MSEKRDLTDSTKGIYDQIAKDNDYYRSIIENNSFYIIKTDLNGNYTYMNPFFCKMLSIREEDYLGKESLSLIMPVDHEVCKETVIKCFEDPEKSHWVILRKPVPNGVLSTQWEFKVLMDDEGQPAEILCIGHDITPLIIKQEELQSLVEVTAEQNKRLVNFTYIISHNIRSHVANIIGIIDLGNEEDIENSKEMWSILQETAGNLDETLHNLNSIIAIQSQTNLPLSYFNIQHEINRIVKSIQILVTEANTTIHYDFDKKAQLYTNPAYFESIILNLLTNALKYKSPDRPLSIDIGWDEQEKYTVLSFKDNGIGIDVERYKDELFGMYKIFHGNKNARGLGLYIIKTQIEAMRGRIEVESEVGENTTFKLFFLNNP
ncbi:hypothetical protein EL17_00395 [Anditalea andensis]|uniref:histidine kinase n=2 Tax=Anditalea andensis TaxID=1048983 RepID=A0A074L029_9BACT|nr:hypothetical protein EL17_00395 [Anditalea andensis]